MTVVNGNRRKLLVKPFHIENIEQKSCFPVYAALHLWDMVKVVFKLIALNALNRKHKNVKTSEPNFQLRKPELKKKTKFNESRRMLRLQQNPFQMSWPLCVPNIIDQIHNCSHI